LLKLIMGVGPRSNQYWCGSSDVVIRKPRILLTATPIAIYLAGVTR